MKTLKSTILPLSLAMAVGILTCNVAQASSVSANTGIGAYNFAYDRAKVYKAFDCALLVLSRSNQQIQTALEGPGGIAPFEVPLCGAAGGTGAAVFTRVEATGVITMTMKGDAGGLARNHIAQFQTHRNGVIVANLTTPANSINAGSITNTCTATPYSNVWGSTVANTMTACELSGHPLACKAGC